MLTLTYGYKKPETGDAGASLWTALQDDIQRLNDHSHNGINSASLSSTALVAVTDNLESADWSAVGLPTGHYKQTVVIPNGFNYDTVQIGFRKASTGEMVYPTVEKVSGTQFTVYTTDNTLDYTVLYGG